MAKFHGKIGFAQSEKTAPGVFSNVFVEKNYTGDVITNTRRWEPSTNLNDNLAINNRFSIVGNAYAYDNISTMRYLKYMGTAWKIVNFEILRPRIILTIGEVYNNAPKD
jgi:hypothetical protein